MFVVSPELPYWKIMNNVQGQSIPSQYLNQAPPKYKLEALQLQPASSVNSNIALHKKLECNHIYFISLSQIIPQLVVSSHPHHLQLLFFWNILCHWVHSSCCFKGLQWPKNVGNCLVSDAVSYAKQTESSNQELVLSFRKRY